MAPYDPPELVGNYISPEETSRLVINAMENNELYVLTHPESEEFIARRFERIRRAFRHLKS